MSEEPRILVYDAFAKERNKGNPAGVVLQADTMGQKQMQQIAYKLGYNETAFVCQSVIADYRIRFFTPGQEVPMCGHATIASVCALYEAGYIGTGKMKIQTSEDILEISIENVEIIRVGMQQNPYREMKFTGDKKELAEAIGIVPDDIDDKYPIVYGSTGLWTLLVPIRSLGCFKKMNPKNSLFPSIMKENAKASVHPFCMETYHTECQMHGRHFSSPYSGTREDPVTGTASGAMAAYYRKYIQTDSERRSFLKIEQGQEIGKDGIVDVMVPSDLSESIKIFGTAVFVEEKKGEIIGI